MEAVTPASSGLSGNKRRAGLPKGRMLRDRNILICMQFDGLLTQVKLAAPSSPVRMSPPDQG